MRFRVFIAMMDGSKLMREVIAPNPMAAVLDLQKILLFDEDGTYYPQAAVVSYRVREIK